MAGHAACESAPPLARRFVRRARAVLRLRGGGCSGSKPDAPSIQDLDSLAAGNPDRDRYTNPKSIWAALATGHVGLVKASYLIKLADEGGVLSRRQELPPEAFVSVKELKALVGKGNEDEVLPVIAISFCWDTAPHPDPSGKQLATVAAALKKEMVKYKRAGGIFKGFSEMGVFWDWASIYQKDPTLFDESETPNAKPEGPERDAFIAGLKAEPSTNFYGGEAYDKSRTPDEIEGFRYALHQTMDLWYAHQGTAVYMLTQLPDGSARKVGYADSGWTTYERCSAEQIKKFSLLAVQWKLVLDLGVGADQERQRAWPVGPDDFDTLVEEKVFTNGSDLGAVKTLYRKMSIAQLGGIEELDFDGMPPPSIEEARRLGGCLTLCDRLKDLWLSETCMSDEACVALFRCIGGGALPELEKLYLYTNQIGDAGCAALAEALGSGAMPKLKELYITGNQIGDAAKQQLKAACLPGEITLND